MIVAFSEGANSGPLEVAGALEVADEVLDGVGASFVLVLQPAVRTPMPMIAAPLATSAIRWVRRAAVMECPLVTCEKFPCLRLHDPARLIAVKIMGR